MKVEKLVEDDDDEEGNVSGDDVGMDVDDEEYIVDSDRDDGYFLRSVCVKKEHRVEHGDDECDDVDDEEDDIRFAQVAMPSRRLSSRGKLQSIQSHLAGAHVSSNRPRQRKDWAEVEVIDLTTMEDKNK